MEGESKMCMDVLRKEAKSKLGNVFNPFLLCGSSLQHVCLIGLVGMLMVWLTPIIRDPLKESYKWREG